MGGLVGFVGSQPGWLPGSAMFTCCCLLSDEEAASHCKIVGGSGGTAGSLVGSDNIPMSPRLFLTHWHVKPGPWVCAGLLVGKAHSLSTTAVSRYCRTCL